MVRRLPRVKATHEKILIPLREYCELCGQMLWVAGHNHRTITTLSGVWRLTVVIRQCVQPACPNFRYLYHPEEEGGWALPHSTIGLDLILFIGLQYFSDPWVLDNPIRFRDPAGPALYRSLKQQNIIIAQRSVTNLIHRYKQLISGPTERLKAKLQQQGQVLLAIEFHIYNPDLLVIIRDCLSTETLLVSSLPTDDSTEFDDSAGFYLADTLIEIRELLNRIGVPIKGLIFPEEKTIHHVVVSVFPGVPYQLHYFRHDDPSETS